MIKRAQVVDPYHNQVGSGTRVTQMLDAIRKGHLRQPLQRPSGLIPETDWDRKNALLEAKTPAEIDTRLPPPPVFQSGPGGRHYAALAKAWGASPSLIKALSPPPIRFNREGNRIN